MLAVVIIQKQVWHLRSKPDMFLLILAPCWTEECVKLSNSGTWNSQLRDEVVSLFSPNLRNWHYFRLQNFGFWLMTMLPFQTKGQGRLRNKRRNQIPIKSLAFFQRPLDLQQLRLLLISRNCTLAMAVLLSSSLRLRGEKTQSLRFLPVTFTQLKPLSIIVPAWEIRS